MRRYCECCRWQELPLFLAKYVVPRVEPEAVAATLEFMGKKGFPVENFADNSIVDRLVREGLIDQLYKKR